MDFDDLLLKVLELLGSEQKLELRKQHFFYLLVDEFQDISPVQYRLIKAWNKGGKELFLIGDPDQSIYVSAVPRATVSTCCAVILNRPVCCV